MITANIILKIIEQEQRVTLCVAFLNDEVSNSLYSLVYVMGSWIKSIKLQYQTLYPFLDKCVCCEMINPKWL